MKVLFILILILIVFALTKCLTNKPVQVKEIELTVIKTESAYREDRNLVWITWADDNGVEYYMLCNTKYRVGDKRIFLITK